MPARNKTKSLQARRGKRIGKKAPWGLFLSGLALVVIGILAVLVFSKSTWTDSNLNLVVRGETQTYVAVFDAKNDAITTIVIPGDTQVETAGNLGELKLRNVWQLALNEGKGGQLLADTVAKNFKFPVYAWADTGGLGFTQGGIKSIQALVTPFSTSLSIIDKIKLVKFSLSVREFKRVEMPLETTGYITNTKLADGTRGYVVSRRIPDKLRVIFADELVSNLSAKVQINDATGVGSSGEVAQILEVYGAKVASVNKISKADYDCRVASENDALAGKIARLFNCEKVRSTEGNFDVEMWLGESFGERF